MIIDKASSIRSSSLPFFVLKKASTCLVFFLMTTCYLANTATAHGYLKSPRSRNWYAASGGGPEGNPPAEYCPHCLNSKTEDQVCATGNTQSYDGWLDVNGNPMPWTNQGIYTEGDEIIIETVLTTNHAGHIDVYVCPDGNDSTHDCFMNNPATFVKDMLHGGPVDSHYPERAYVSPSAEHKFKYRLPNGISGDKVMLMWRYVTANSCFPPGYKRAELGLRERGWLRAEGMGDCAWPLNKTGARDSSNPEQFWNCADLVINPANPTVSPKPSPAPVPTPVPTKAPVQTPVLAPTPVTGGCCTWNGGQSCGPTWCNENKSQCEGNCYGSYVSKPTTPPPVPAPTPPTGEDKATTTRYWDCSGGSCGCAYLPFGTDSEPAHCYSNAMFAAPEGNEYGAKFYGTAAISQALGGGNWLSEGCGKCWKVHGWSNVPNKDTYQTTLVLKGTNYCPPTNPACANGKAHFDISAPGFDVTQFSLSNTCAEREKEELEGFKSCGRWMIDDQNPDVGCDCSKFNNPVLRAGCENFYSLLWNNAEVSYEEVTCPEELNRLNCWEENGGGYPDGIPQFCASNLEGTFPPSPEKSYAPSLRGTSTPTKAPIKAPTKAPVKAPTKAPVKAPTSGGEYCCSDNFKDCKPEDDWCAKSESNCRNCNAQWMQIDPTCTIGNWGDCKNNKSGCCPPSTCHDFGYWAQCRV